ncbi:AAA family ATPase [Acaryochloris marina NIES-2412]|uniref:AAA family ATPase n=1 Tax=Acaryochloris marina TaxID=155978 RepID=UPI004058FCE7
MDKRLCHFLIGLPGAGKSTFAQVLIQINPHSVWICPDHIREQLYGDASIQGTWTEIQIMIDQQFDQAIQAQHPVIYDATNVKAQWRRDFLQRYSPPGIQWLGWQLNASAQDCIHRNHLRSHAVPQRSFSPMPSFSRISPLQLPRGSSKSCPFPLTAKAKSILSKCSS